MTITALTAADITDQMINELRDEASNAGDREMVELCDSASNGDDAGIDAVLDALNWARANS